MNAFQERALELVAAFVADYPCVKQIAIFGSVARGDTATADDVDLCVEYLDVHQIAQSDELTASYGAFQQALQDWAEATRDLLFRPIRFSHPYIDSKYADKQSGKLDEVWVLIQQHATMPTGRLGKAVLAPTPAREKHR